MLDVPIDQFSYNCLILQKFQEIILKAVKSCHTIKYKFYYKKNIVKVSLGNSLNISQSFPQKMEFWASPVRALENASQ